MSASVLLFAFLNALVKWLMATYPAPEVILFRSGFALIPCLWLVQRNGGRAVLRTKHRWWHITRAGAQLVSMLAMFTAYGMMPLATAVAISFTSGLFQEA